MESVDTTIAQQIKAGNKMAESKLAWIMFNVLGWSGTALTILGAFDEPYKSIMSILSILFITVSVMRSFEKWRELRISNNERQYELKRKHARQNRNQNHA